MQLSSHRQQCDILSVLLGHSEISSEYLTTSRKQKHLQVQQHNCVTQMPAWKHARNFFFKDWPFLSFLRVRCHTLYAFHNSMEGT